VPLHRRKHSASACLRLLLLVSPGPQHVLSSGNSSEEEGSSEDVTASEESASDTDDSSSTDAEDGEEALQAVASPPVSLAAVFVTTEFCGAPSGNCWAVSGMDDWA
jgi:hypothetical protein